MNTGDGSLCSGLFPAAPGNAAPFPGQAVFCSFAYSIESGKSNGQSKNHSSSVRITFGRAKRFQTIQKNFFLRPCPRTRRSPFPSGGRRSPPSHARRLSDEGERTVSASPLIRRSPSSPASRDCSLRSSFACKTCHRQLLLWQKSPLGEAQKRTGDGSLCSVSSLRTQRTELCVLRGTHRTVPCVPYPRRFPPSRSEKKPPGGGEEWKMKNEK